MVLRGHSSDRGQGGKTRSSTLPGQRDGWGAGSKEVGVISLGTHNEASPAQAVFKWEGPNCD